LAIFLIARLVREKRQPGKTFAWLLAIILIPYVGVPLYLLFGGRKLKRLVAEKNRLSPDIPDDALSAVYDDYPIARAITSSGGSPPVGGNALSLLKRGRKLTTRLKKAS
jgi:cardiolipin synthase